MVRYSDGARRALLHFDVGDSVPSGARVTGVSLVLNMSKAPNGVPSSSVSVHRVVLDWGEAGSQAAVPQPSG